MALWLYRIGFLAATEAPKFICCSQVSLFFSENPTNPCESAAEVVTEGLRCRLCGVLPALPGCQWRSWRQLNITAHSAPLARLQTCGVWTCRASRSSATRRWAGDLLCRHSFEGAPASCFHTLFAAGPPQQCSSCCTQADTRRPRLSQHGVGHASFLCRAPSWPSTPPLRHP